MAVQLSVAVRNRGGDGVAGPNGRLVSEAPGTRYGRLTVVGRGQKKPGQEDNNAMWRCQCDCGNMVTVRGRQLRAGKSQSCGCLRLDALRRRMSLPDGMAGRNRVLYQYKRNAETRGYEWSLTDEQAHELTQGDCHYCGTAPAQHARATTSPFIYNGLDRVDNRLGYIAGNVVSCCFECNDAKGSLSAAGFLKLAARVYEHSIKGK